MKSYGRPGSWLVGEKQATPVTESYETSRRLDPSKARRSDRLEFHLLGHLLQLQNPRVSIGCFLVLPPAFFDLPPSCPL